MIRLHELLTVLLQDPILQNQIPDSFNLIEFINCIERNSIGDVQTLEGLTKEILILRTSEEITHYLPNIKENSTNSILLNHLENKLYDLYNVKINLK